MRIRLLPPTIVVALALLAGLPLPSRGAAPEAPSAGAPSAAPAGGNNDAAAPDNVSLPPGAESREVIRKDARIRFTAVPLHGPALMEGEVAEIAFRIEDAATGSPIGSLYPSAWVDTAEASGLAEGKVVECGEKVSAFLRGALGYQPLIDLNSYFILGMNNDATISVFDPVRGVSNVTQMFTMIYLKNPGEDWALDGDGKFLFVTVPKSDAVAVVSTETFQVVREIPVGKSPGRIVLQPDRNYFWVGLDGKGKEGGGLAVIDAASQKAVSRIPLGPGRHEVVLSDDSRYAFAVGEGDRTLSVLDVRTLGKAKELRLAGTPAALAYSGQAKAAYVALREGGIAVVDGRRHEVVATIPTKPGLSALRFAPGGRWGFAANGPEDVVYVVDASTNRVRHTLAVGREPYQIAFTEKFAYLRSRQATTLFLLELSWLETEGGEAPLLQVEIGVRPPSASRFGSVADAIVPVLGGGHTVIANPADSMIYYYMEGMNASMAGYRSVGGHVPRAALLVDRSLKEKEKGVYASTVRLPVPGKMQVALFLDSPRVVQCFEFSVKPNPLFEKERGTPQIAFLSTGRQAEAGEPFTVRFRLSYRRTEEPIRDVRDLTVQAVHSSGIPVLQFGARHLEDGVYEATVVLSAGGWYNLLFSSPSMDLRAGQLAPYPVRAKTPGVSGKKPGTR